MSHPVACAPAAHSLRPRLRDDLAEVARVGLESHDHLQAGRPAFDSAALMRPAARMPARQEGGGLSPSDDPRGRLWTSGGDHEAGVPVPPVGSWAARRRGRGQASYRARTALARRGPAFPAPRPDGCEVAWVTTKPLVRSPAGQRQGGRSPRRWPGRTWGLICRPAWSIAAAARPGPARPGRDVTRAGAREAMTRRWARMPIDHPWF